MRKEYKVYIVGAGPGDPELLTVKALRLLREADVVVYDRLISAEILALVPAGVTLISVGKESGNHSLSQTEINQLITRLALSGRNVVRLKGGDPFVFGRGSEEAEHLRRHGVDYEIVPGITAAVGATAYAGIPLTHRGLSRGVRLVTGHFREDEPLDLDWRALADPEATLVIYMGLANFQRISAELIRAGLSPSTPAAAIQDGTTPRQRRVIAQLANLDEAVREAMLHPPVTLVIGRTVALAQELEWFSPQEDGEARNSASA